MSPIPIAFLVPSKLLYIYTLERYHLLSMHVQQWTSYDPSNHPIQRHSKFTSTTTSSSSYHRLQAILHTEKCITKSHENDVHEEFLRSLITSTRINRIVVYFSPKAQQDNCIHSTISCFKSS